MGDVKIFHQNVEENEVAKKLSQVSLGMYSDALVHTLGYDMLTDIEDLTPTELDTIADQCGMKPGHKKRFAQTFSPHGQPAVTMGLTVEFADEGSPSSPRKRVDIGSADPSRIQLQEASERWIRDLEQELALQKMKVGPCIAHNRPWLCGGSLRECLHE